MRVIDENTIAVPDRRGNNRIDSLRNLIIDPRVALLLLIPGVSETLRIRRVIGVDIHRTFGEGFFWEQGHAWISSRVAA